jgi:DNA (cytosine-5)-methyltransferase 1
MIAIDFFCGAGGLTKGLTMAGINVVLGIDNNINCKGTYELNNPESKFLNVDISKTDIRDLEPYLGDYNSTEVLFAGCAPCQPFTKLKVNNENEFRSRLLGEFTKLVKAFQPGYVVIENVPGIAKVPGFSTFRRFLKVLKDSGYEYCQGILDAKDYGVPQTRNRIVLIASKNGKPTLPSPTHGPGLKPYETVADAISHFPAIEAGESHPTVPNHRASKLSDKNLERIQKTPHNGGDRRSWPLELWLECHKKGHSGHTDVYGRMWWKKPAPSITCRCDSLSNGRFGHPEQNRAISLREAASLQGFPDDYVFYGSSKSIIAAQIGNAVPIQLARRLGEHIIRLHKNGRQNA